jgi:hypothetical protein
MSEFNMIDTKRVDGCYVRFERIEKHDSDATPMDYLFQDEDYRDEDQRRLDAWHNDEWSFIGIQARAHITVVSNGVGAMYTMTSPGLWGVESDSGEDYLEEIYAQEKATLLGHLAQMGNPIVE